MEPDVLNTDELETDIELDGGNLPSTQDEKQLSLDGFSITDEIQQKYFKHGKLNGRFDNIEELILANKAIEDKYSNLMRDIKSGKSPESEQVQDIGEVDVMQVAQPLIEKFVSNGMELTDEILNEAKEKGLDIRDVKLAAIEMKEQVTKAYNVVGGKEEYEAMISWGKANLDDKAKAEFDKGIASGLGEYAIKGLHAEYKASNSTQEVSQRIMGDGSSGQGIKPYASVDEIMRDKKYLDSVAGRNDQGAKDMYNRRMNKTPDSVVFARR